MLNEKHNALNVSIAQANDKTRPRFSQLFAEQRIESSIQSLVDVFDQNRPAELDGDFRLFQEGSVGGTDDNKVCRCGSAAAAAAAVAAAVAHVSYPSIGLTLRIYQQWPLPRKRNYHRAVDADYISG